MPYFIGRILEIPLTTIQDYMLFHLLGDYSIDLWKRQLAMILEHNGLASFIVHPDYIIERRARGVYEELLDHLSFLRTQRNARSEEHTSELQSLTNLVCRLLLEKKN